MFLGERVSSTPDTFTAYSGTTIGNFRIAAYIRADGTIVYDKTRNPNHKFRGIFFGINPGATYGPTSGLAIRQRDLPVIMAGDLDNQYRDLCRHGNPLPNGTIFPVSETWVLKEDQQGLTRLRELIYSKGPAASRDQAIRELFVYCDPVSLLEDVKPVTIA